MQRKSWAEFNFSSFSTTANLTYNSLNRADGGGELNKWDNQQSTLWHHVFLAADYVLTYEYNIYYVYYTYIRRFLLCYEFLWAGQLVHLLFALFHYSALSLFQSQEGSKQFLPPAGESLTVDTFVYITQLFPRASNKGIIIKAWILKF